MNMLTRIQHLLFSVKNHNIQTGKLILIFFSGLLFSGLLFSINVWAANPVLQWDENADADYYVVYWRSTGDIAPTGHSESIPAGTLTFPLTASSNGQEYYYSVKAFNNCGNSSVFSDEIKTAHLPFGSTDINSESTADNYSLEIILPEQGAMVQEGYSSEFSANAYKNDQLVLTDQVLWNSSIDGFIGKGSDVSARLSSGFHTIIATMDTGQGKTEVDTLIVTVVQNKPPEISIVESMGGATETNGQNFTFTGKAMDAEDGDLSNAIQWRSSLDGALISGQTIHAVLSPGNHILTAMVADKNGQSKTASVTVTAKAYNTTPEITIVETRPGDASPDGQIYTLTGQASDHEDGNLSAAIVWTSDRIGELGRGAMLKVQLSPGKHTLNARIVDSQQAAMDDSVIVSVSPWNFTPIVSITSMVPGTLGPEGQAYTLSGSATDGEDGDLSTKIAWSSSKDGQLGTGKQIQALLSSGQHTLTASITDSQGQRTDVQKTISVAMYNHSPDITITSSHAGTFGPVGLAYTLAGTARDAEDGDLSAKIMWSSSKDGPLGSGKEIQTHLTTGQHTLTAAITDSQGKRAEAHMTTVVVNENSAPVISMTSATPGALGPNGQAYTFTATASDVEDGDLSSNIVWSSSLAGIMGTGRSIQVTLGAGSHTILAKVNDKGGKSQSATKMITVETYDNQPTVVIAQCIKGTQNDEGQQCDLSAKADDPEDGNLSGSIVWTSSIQGALGTGSDLQVRLRPGNHTLTARVKDSRGNSGEAVMPLNIGAINRPPVLTAINAFKGPVAASGLTYTLSSQALDPEDGNLSSSIVWSTSGDRQLGVGAVIKVILPYGNQTVRAHVSDQNGNNCDIIKTISVVWINQKPVVSINNPKAGAAGKGGQVYTLTGRATDMEDGDLSAQLVWTSNRDGVLGTGSELLVTLSEGIHIITAQVSDQNKGLSSGRRTVTVEPFNVPPQVNIIRVIGGTVNSQSQVFEFTGKAQDDEDGDLSSAIVWSSDQDGLLGKGATIKTELSGGNHIIQATITDKKGKATSITVDVTSLRDSGPMIQISSYRLFYFNIVTINWSGALSDVALFKDDRRIGSGGPEGSRYYWASGEGAYKVCEMMGGRCSDTQRSN